MPSQDLTPWVVLNTGDVGSVGCGCEAGEEGETTPIDDVCGSQPPKETCECGFIDDGFWREPFPFTNMKYGFVRMGADPYPTPEEYAKSFDELGSLFDVMQPCIFPFNTFRPNTTPKQFRKAPKSDPLPWNHSPHIAPPPVTRELIRAQQNRKDLNFFGPIQTFDIPVLDVLGGGILLNPSPESKASISVSVVARQGICVIVHCDPHQKPDDIPFEGESETNFDRLLQIIDTANDDGVKLTIMLSYPWIEKLFGEFFPWPSPFGRYYLELWSDAGHEIGFHHHDITHASNDSDSPGGVENSSRCGMTLEQYDAGKSNEGWINLTDGYDSECAVLVDPNDGYIGFEGLRGLMSSIGLKVRSASFGTSDAARNYEWIQDIEYSQSSAQAALRDVSTIESRKPTCEIYEDDTDSSGLGDSHVGVLYAFPFETTSGGGLASLDIIEAVLTQPWSDGCFFGVAFHPHEWSFTATTDDGKIMAELILQLIQAVGDNTVRFSLSSDQKITLTMSEALDNALGGMC